MRLRERYVWPTIGAIVLATLLAGLSAGCGDAYRPPPNLTPEATAAWHGKKVVIALDTIRDMAIAANETTPPLMATADTRKVVLYHESALKTMLEIPNGWRPVVERGLDEVIANLPAADQQMLRIYVELAKTVINEVGQ